MKLDTGGASKNAFMRSNRFNIPTVIVEVGGVVASVGSGMFAVEVVVTTDGAATNAAEVLMKDRLFMIFMIYRDTFFPFGGSIELAYHDRHVLSPNIRRYHHQWYVLFSNISHHQILL